MGKYNKSDKKENKQSTKIENLKEKIQQNSQSSTLSIEKNESIQDKEDQNIQNKGYQLKLQENICINCKKKSAFRVLINKECDIQKYINIICNECLNMTTKNQKQNKSSKQQQQQQFYSINQNELNKTLELINDLRQNLFSLKSYLNQLIINYQPILLSKDQVETSLISALTFKDQDILQNEINLISKRVVYNKQFQWKDDAIKIQSDLDKATQQNQNLLQEIYWSITGLIKQEVIFDLNKINIKTQPIVNNLQLLLDYKYLNNEIWLTNISQEIEYQFYLDFIMDPKKKYILKFRFENELIQAHAILGIMPADMVDNNWVFGMRDHYFCKRFYACYSPFECSNIIKGQELSISAQKGISYEIRIDFENNYVDFTDFPQQNYINSNHKSNKLFLDKSYVFAFSFYQYQSIVIEEIKEVISFSIPLL